MIEFLYFPSKKGFAMNLKMKCDPVELAKGHLFIFGKSSGTETLTAANLTELVDAVRHGFVDQHGVRHQPIARLTLIQVKFPRNNGAFSAFMDGLLGETHFVDLDFRGGSPVSPVLSPANTGILTNTVAQATHLRRLVVNVPDVAVSGQQLADMIRANRSLTYFMTDLTDDVYQFGVTKAVIETHNVALARVELQCTSKPDASQLRGTTIVGARNLLISFEGGRELPFTTTGAGAAAPKAPAAPMPPRSPRSSRGGRRSFGVARGAAAGPQDASDASAAASTGAARQAGLMPAPKVGE